MRTRYFAALCVVVATSSTSFAQEESSEAETMAEEVMEEMTEEVVEEIADDVMSDEVMADDVMSEDGAEEVMVDDALENAASDEVVADEVMEEETPSLEDIAASDPALDVRTNEDGEVDAMVMLADVLFSFGDASLEPAALDVLRGVAEKLDGVPSIAITGHTDAIGDEDFNLALGQRRADAVRDWLIANTDLTADVITAVGVGEADPIAPNRTEAGADNPEGRALNRRVEFTLPEES